MSRGTLVGYHRFILFTLELFGSITPVSCCEPRLAIWSFSIHIEILLKPYPWEQSDQNRYQSNIFKCNKFWINKKKLPKIHNFESFKKAVMSANILEKNCSNYIRFIIVRDELVLKINIIFKVTIQCISYISKIKVKSSKWFFKGLIKISKECYLYKILWPTRSFSQHSKVVSKNKNPK